MLYSRFLLVAHFKYNSVYTSIKGCLLFKDFSTYVLKGLTEWCNQLACPPAESWSSFISIGTYLKEGASRLDRSKVTGKLLNGDGGWEFSIHMCLNPHSSGSFITDMGCRLGHGVGISYFSLHFWHLPLSCPGGGCWSPCR